MLVTLNRCGKYFLINPKMSVRETQIPIPETKAVKIKFGLQLVNARIIVAIKINNIAIIKDFSMPKRLLNFIAKRAKIPMHNTGKVVIKLAETPLMDRSLIIISSTGPTEVIDGRIFKERKKIITNR